jgi:hypothetical protein
MLNRLIIMALAASAIGPPRTTQQVPAALLAAADRDPVAFVMLLAEAAIPAGLEVREPDAHPKSGQRFDLPRDAGTAPMAAANDLIAAFNRAHPEYQAAMADGVIVVRPATRVPDYLDQPSTLGQFTGKGLMRVAEHLFAPLDPKLAAPGGRLGSYPGAIGVEVDRGEQLQITVDGRGLTNLGVLNQVARQAAGHPWLVVVDDIARTPHIVRVGFINRAGTTTETSLTQR